MTDSFNSKPDADKTKEDELAGTEQPFVQHLVELRDRLLHALYGVGIILVVLLFYPGPSHLYDLLALPLVKSLPEGSRMIAVGVVSPFLVPIKVSVMAAVGLSLPWILFQIWSFVAPGLYKHEKKLILPLVAASTILFYLGAAFCYFFVFGQAFPAIQRMAPISVAVSPDIEAYLDFVITMFIAFGVAFEVRHCGGYSCAHGHCHRATAQGFSHLFHRRCCGCFRAGNTAGSCLYVGSAGAHVPPV